jgi:hypothetical protein
VSFFLDPQGTGKTLICIGLILLTKGTQCTPTGHHKIHRAALPAKRAEGTMAEQRTPPVLLLLFAHSRWRTLTAAAAASADVLPCEWSDDSVDNGPVLSLKALAGSLVKCATGAQLERMNLPAELREFIQALPSPYILYDHHRKRQDTKKAPRSSERRRASSSSESDAQARGTSGMSILVCVCVCVCVCRPGSTMRCSILVHHAQAMARLGRASLWRCRCIFPRRH